MKTDKILLIFILIVIIVFFSYLEANILKITKGIVNYNQTIILLKTIEKNIRIYSFIFIAILLSIFIMFVIQIRRGIKKENRRDMDPFIGIFEKYQTDKKILKEEKEKALSEIEEAKSMYDTLFNNSYLGILLIDEYSRIIKSNKVANKIFNKGGDFPSLVSLNSLNSMNSIRKNYEYFKNEQVNFYENEIEFENKILNLTFFKNEKNKTFVFIRDITELKMAERKISVRKQEEVLGEMASYLSHEIKNSLGIIIGYIGMVKKTKKIDNLDKAMNESRKLLQMLEDYLDLSKSVDKKMENLNIYNSLIESSKSFQIIVDIDNSLKDLLIEGDKKLFERIFINLFKNSQEAGAKRIKIEKILEREELIKIRYSDDGAGIKQEFANKVFLPFFSTKDSGSGMGLSIVKKFLNDCGGDIILERSETGTVFLIDFKKQIR